jgi:hypothetical protein
MQFTLSVDLLLMFVRKSLQHPLNIKIFGTPVLVMLQKIMATLFFVRKFNPKAFGTVVTGE